MVRRRVSVHGVQLAWILDLRQTQVRSHGVISALQAAYNASGMQALVDGAIGDYWWSCCQGQWVGPRLHLNLRARCVASRPCVRLRNNVGWGGWPGLTAFKYIGRPKVHHLSHGQQNNCAAVSVPIHLTADVVGL
jgi:hypothetical protein